MYWMFTSLNEPFYITVFILVGWAMALVLAIICTILTPFWILFTIVTWIMENEIWFIP